ncbi:hypothetical protein [Streptomyces achromogenes]|uniref:hypothetical protein n=1 Tax=Streptomyces achromogenes TaxID=67255 RepID=UPI003A7F9940
MSDYEAHRARLIGYLTQAGLSTRRAHANLDALLAAAPTNQPMPQEMRPENVPHDLVMAGVRAAGALSADSVRAVLAAVLPLVTNRTTEQ